MRMARWIVFTTVAASTLLLAARAGAVPAFARREGVTCQMCHFRPPELNEDGREYLRRGTREQPGGGMHGGMGAPGGASLGEPAAIQWENYFSVIGDHGVTHVENEGTAFDAGGLDLLIGGPFDRHWSALANPSFDIEGGGADVGQAWGMLMSDWTPRFQAARFGQLLPFAILLNQGDVTMSSSTPLVLSQPVQGGSGWTPATLLRGAEFGMVDDSHWNAAFGVAQPHFEGVEVAGHPHTDVYGSAEFVFTPRGTSLTGYGYWGRLGGRDFHRVGIFGNFYHRDVTKIVAGVLAGTDEAEDGTDLDNNGFFILGEQLLTDRWAAYARFDRTHQDLPDGGTLTLSGPALGASFWAQTHVWFTGEAQFLDSSPGASTNSYSLKITWTM